MLMDDSWWMEWYSGSISDDERKMVDLIYDLEKHFEDMLFEPGTPSGDLIKCQSKSNNEDGWYDDILDRPDELQYFSLTFFHYKVDADIDCEGYFNRKDQLLCVHPRILDDVSVILHEMIHLHEFVVNELPLYYHDALYWSLYAELKNKIPDLDEIITTRTHLLIGSTIYNQGGLHDILFLLKSFDLDIRMGYSLGTVFAYGAADEFKGYHYKIDGSNL